MSSRSFSVPAGENWLGRLGVRELRVIVVELQAHPGLSERSYVPARGEIASARRRRAAGRNVLVPAVRFALHHQRVARGGARIDSHSALAHAPGIRGVIAIREQLVIAIEVLPIDAEGGVRAHRAAVPCAGEVVR